MTLDGISTKFWFYFSLLYLKFLVNSEVFLFTYNVIITNPGLTIKSEEL